MCTAGGGGGGGGDSLEAAGAARSVAAACTLPFKVDELFQALQNQRAMQGMHSEANH